MIKTAQANRPIQKAQAIRPRLVLLHALICRWSLLLNGVHCNYLCLLECKEVTGLPDREEDEAVPLRRGGNVSRSTVCPSPATVPCTVHSRWRGIVQSIAQPKYTPTTQQQYPSLSREGRGTFPLPDPAQAAPSFPPCTQSTRLV